VKVAVRLFATLEKFLPPGAGGDSAWLELASGATVAQALALLRIPAEIEYLTVVNGRDVDPGHVLEPGDEVAVFPPLAGGR